MDRWGCGRQKQRLPKSAWNSPVQFLIPQQKCKQRLGRGGRQQDVYEEGIHGSYKFKSPEELFSIIPHRPHGMWQHLVTCLVVILGTGTGMLLAPSRERLKVLQTSRSAWDSTPHLHNLQDSSEMPAGLLWQVRCMTAIPVSSIYIEHIYNIHGM